MDPEARIEHVENNLPGTHNYGPGIGPFHLQKYNHLTVSLGDKSQERDLIMNKH